MEKMTSIIHFTPISGANNEDSPCYLLQIDEFVFLLDCGCDENYRIDYVDQLKSYIPSIDAVLLSHPDTSHLGALPYLVGKCGLSCPVYATTPVYQMGQMFAYDLHQSRYNYEEFDLFSLDDIDMAFEKVVQVKYNQTISFEGKGQGLTITPLPAGHMLGGTIWRIVKDGGEDIVYVTDFNHKKENHLNSCVLDQISRPSLLIIDCRNVNYVPDRRRTRELQLIENIVTTLRNDGNVLVTLDTAGRVLELSYLLEQSWRNDPALQAYQLILLNNFSYNVIEFSKSLVEWMSDKLMRTFEGQRNNPFAFRHLQWCQKITDLAHFKQPYCILASQPDMECGFSRELFFTMASDKRSTIFLTQRPTPGTLAETLLKLANSNSRVVKVEKKCRIPLIDAELEEYLETKRQEAIEKERQKVQNSDSKEDDDSDDSDEDFFGGSGGKTINDKNDSPLRQVKMSDTEQPLHRSGVVKHDLMMFSRVDGRFKGGGFFKNVKKSYPMFPCVERKLKWDEYGEVINHDDYVVFDMSRMLLEEKENIDELSNGNTKVADDVNLLAGDNKPPTKCICTTENVTVHCTVEFIDFEGCSDGESLKKIISVVRPRRLILVHGSEAKIEAFNSFCRSNELLMSSKLFCPKVLEMVDATTERHIYPVKLRDALVSSLRFVQAKNNAQLSWVDAEILITNPESLLPQTEEECNDETAEQQKTTTDNSVVKQSTEQRRIQRSGGREVMPTLQQMPPMKVASHPVIFVNELKLSDFKQILMKHGIQAEFSGGALLCNGIVEVRRSDTGHIQLEGTLSEDYFTVRRLLYDQFAVL